MILFPVILNALNFWLIDNILKFNPEEGVEGGAIVAHVYQKEEERNNSQVNRSKHSKHSKKSNRIDNVIIAENKNEI
jgi:hypothetical protein